MMSATKIVDDNDDYDGTGVGVGINNSSISNDDNPHPPDLSSHYWHLVEWWTFWSKALAWPAAVVAVNGLVLVAYELIPIYVDWFFPAVRGVLFAVDAIFFLAAAIIVEKDVAAWDELVDELEKRDSSTTNHRHVHGQLSRKLDVLLERSDKKGGPAPPTTTSTEQSPPRVSILISLLLLGSVVCTAFSVTFIAEWTFLTTIYPYQCGEYDVTDTTAGTHVDDIDGIPHELQNWARGNRLEWFDESDNGGTSPVIRLVDGTTFVLGFEPKPPSESEPPQDAAKATSSNSLEQLVFRKYGSYRYRYADPVLVAVSGTKGDMQFLSNVRRPRRFVVLTDAATSTTDSKNANATAISLNAPGFCCIFSGNDLAIMCYQANSAVDIAMLKKGEVRNATLAVYFDAEKPNMHYRLGYTTLQWHANQIWVRVDWRNYEHDLVVNMFYKASVQSDQPHLQLQSVANVTLTNAELQQHGHGARCSDWLLQYMKSFGIAVSMALAWYWLRRIRNLPVAVVPALAAFMALLAILDTGLVSLMCFLITVAAFAALCAGKDAVQIHQAVGTEELVWIMYARVWIPMAVAYEHDMMEYALYDVVLCTVMGSILGHPALYIVGWAGGSLVFLIGFFAYMYQQQISSIFLMVAGIIGGAGCVAVGKLLIQYKSFLAFYARRAWRAAVQQIQALSPDEADRLREYEATTTTNNDTSGNRGSGSSGWSSTHTARNSVSDGDCSSLTTALLSPHERT